MMSFRSGQMKRCYASLVFVIHINKGTTYKHARNGRMSNAGSDRQRCSLLIDSCVRREQNVMRD